MSRSNDIAGLTTSILDGVTATEVGLGNVDNTADSAKPVSTAQQTALDAKLATTTATSTYAPLASPTFTGTVSGVTASHITSGTLGSSVVVPASVGGTMVFIDKNVSSGSTAIMEFDSLDNTYAFYKFILFRVYPATDDKNFYVSLSTSSSYLTGGSDYLNGSSQYVFNNDSYNNASGYLAWAYSVGNNYNNDSGICGELNLWNCSDSSINTSANWKFLHTNQNQLIYGNEGVGNTNGTLSPITKIKFHFESATNFASGSTIVRYGVKHG